MSDIGGFAKSMTAMIMAMLSPITTYLFYISLIQKMYQYNDGVEKKMSLAEKFKLGLT